MMHFRSIFLILGILCIHFNSKAQYEIGEASGYGKAGLSLENVWALQNNQAGVAELENIEAGFAYQMAFGISENSTKCVAVAIPLNNGTVGLSLNSYGYKLYNQGKYGLSYARKLGENLNAGVQINYESISIGESYGNAAAMTFEGGFQFYLKDNIIISGHLFNPNKSAYNVPAEVESLSRLKGGFKYIFSEKVFLVGEVWKDSENDPKAIIGTEFRPNDMFYLRLGVSNNPSQSSFGIGLNVKSFTIDLATDFHSDLGVSPNISIRYAN